MKTLLLLAIAWLTVSCSSTLYVYKTETQAIAVTGEISVEKRDEMWAAACAEVAVFFECPEVKPVVLSAELSRSTYGLYISDTQVVFVSDRLVGPHWDVFADAVLLHEMVHYIHWTNDPINFTPCSAEQYAWDAFNRYVRRVGRLDYLELNWKANYRCA